MDRKIKVAVMGATGAVGQVFMWMLSDHPWFELAYCTASAARVGQKYASTVHWVMPFEIPQQIKDIEVKEFDFDAMEEAGVQIVFSALPAAVAAEAEPQLRARGFYVFSNAAAMRYESNVPILIPETNVEQLDLIRSQGFPNSGFVVTNANCVTTGLAMALAPLRKFGIRTITINSYQSVSGAGYPGLSSFDITDNCIPFIKGEEEKIEKEVKKILSIDPEVYAYTVRVPVMFGHLETVWLDLEQDVEVDDVIRAWADFKEVQDLPSTPEQPGADVPAAQVRLLGQPEGHGRLYGKDQEAQWKDRLRPSGQQYRQGRSRRLDPERRGLRCKVPGLSRTFIMSIEGGVSGTSLSFPPHSGMNAP